ncbi:SDR family oxidoreductase [Candidatus Parcubacteria bacterium]|nr:MAG: SDR family oxidoreductase [Candidatus Parcubacteria bacterium]
MKKTVIVVGASGGIGNKIAEFLLDKDYFVVGTYFNHPERIENIANNNFKSKHLNLQDVDSVKALFNQINEQVYAVVNCAGICEFENGDLENDFEIWQKTLAVNLSGNYYLAKLFKEKIEQGGRFIMISSTDSFYGGNITASYAASKNGVNSLTRSLSLIFSDRKIRVNSVAPGWVLTSMIKSNGTEFLDKVAEINPLKRNAKPEDVANLIIFLLSDEANYINGQIIPLEGGYTNQDPTLLIEEKL